MNVQDDQKTAPAAQEAQGAASQETPAAEKKGAATQPRSIAKRPAECAGCGKNIGKVLWYYRNGKFYCNITCFKKKTVEDAKKATGDKAKAKS